MDSTIAIDPSNLHRITEESANHTAWKMQTKTKRWRRQISMFQFFTIVWHCSHIAVVLASTVRLHTWILKKLEWKMCTSQILCTGTVTILSLQVSCLSPSLLKNETKILRGCKHFQGNSNFVLHRLNSWTELSDFLGGSPFRYKPNGHVVGVPKEKFSQTKKDLQCFPSSFSFQRTFLTVESRVPQYLDDTFGVSWICFG